MQTHTINYPLPADLTSEVFEDILRAPGVRIERIVSKGHSSPESGWYDQEEHEWVMVVQGAGLLIFEDGSECQLSAGDYITIPAHCKHKVKWTDPDQVTVWLAVFYS
ncbi:MAG: cupin domain-containing protein [Marinagarivorans sp.]